MRYVVSTDIRESVDCTRMMNQSHLADSINGQDNAKLTFSYRIRARRSIVAACKLDLGIVLCITNIRIDRIISLDRGRCT